MQKVLKMLQEKKGGKTDWFQVKKGFYVKRFVRCLNWFLNTFEILKTFQFIE